MKRASLILMAATGMFGLPLSAMPNPSPEKNIKLCLQCGTPHRHNNSFCSAECCRSHKRK